MTLARKKVTTGVTLDEARIFVNSRSKPMTLEMATCRSII